MKKRYLLLFVFLFLVGCGTNLEDEISKKVKEESSTVIIANITTLSDTISMFPTRNDEEKFIYYVKEIGNNCTRFSSEELSEIENILNIPYNFNLNKINYSINNFNNDLMIIHNCK